jgi:hypothetical protein
MIAIAAGAASGCSGAQGASGQPDVATPASSVTSSPSASPSTTASATLDDAARARIPTAARAHTPQGAEAFARFYLEQVNEAWMVPDPELIRPYALESCKTCANYVHTAESLKADGRRYEDDPSKVGPSIVMPESTPSIVVVHIGQVQLPTRILRSDGSVDRVLKKVPGEVEIELQFPRDAWQIGEIRGLVG